MNKHQFLWLDLETTGLEPQADQILEWAVVLVEDGQGGDLSPVAQYSAVVNPWGGEAATHIARLAHDNPFVHGMHTRNGLLAEVPSADTLGEAEEFLVCLCRELANCDKPKGIVLAGSSVHFDLGFIRVHMPKFAKCLSHRVFDVSTLKLAAQAWGGEKFAKAEVHRALPDILESLEHARLWREAHTVWSMLK